MNTDLPVSLEVKRTLIQNTNRMRRLEAAAREARHEWEDSVYQASPYWTYGDIATFSGLSRVRIDQVLRKVRQRRESNREFSM